MADAGLRVATRIFDDQFYRTQADRIAYDHHALLGSRRGVGVRGCCTALTLGLTASSAVPTGNRIRLRRGSPCNSTFQSR